MITTLALAGLAALGLVIWFQFPQWGRAPRGERLAWVTASPRYRGGEFQVLTPMIVEAAGLIWRG